MSPENARRNVERLTILLHDLIRRDEGDGASADDIRESLTSELAQLPDDEKRLLTSLAGDLYMLANAERPLPAPNLGVLSIREAWNARDWRRLLVLLACDIPDVHPHYRAYLRGRAWGELGYPLAAAQFLGYAWQLQGDKDNYGYLTIQAYLDAGDFESAWKLSGRLLADDQPSATLFYKIADVLYAAAHRSNQPIQNRLYGRVVEVVDRARALAAQPSVTSIVVGGLVKKAFALANTEQIDNAENALSEALRVDHESDVALSARGLLRMDAGRAAEAYVDFARAAGKGTTFMWPFFYLAKHALDEHDYDRCLDLVAAGLARTSDARARANLLEWNAIALRALGRDHEALESADEAELLEPFNDRIVKNGDSIRRAQPLAQLEVVVDLSPRQAMRIAA